MYWYIEAIGLYLNTDAVSSIILEGVHSLVLRVYDRVGKVGNVYRYGMYVKSKCFQHHGNMQEPKITVICRNFMRKVIEKKVIFV